MRTFTVEEANSLLPTVRGAVVEIQGCHQRLLRFADKAKKAAEGADRGGGGLIEGTRYASLLIKLGGLMKELESLGVKLKDFERGLVDFPSLREGRVVLLCWHLGEGDTVEWWHDVDAGFAGRTPL